MSRRLVPIFLIVLVDIFGLTLVIPLLTIYAEHFHATPLQATLLVSIYAACQLVSGPMLGQISDRVGRKPMLIVSQIGTFIGFVILARAWALWVLYLSRVIDGATAGNISLAQAYVSDNTEPKDRAKAFAIIGIAFGLGFFVGPFVTGALYKHGLNAPIYVAAALSATSILCTTTLLPGGKPPGARHAGSSAPGGTRLSVLDWGAYAMYFRRPVLNGLLVQFFFYALSFSTFNSGFALFAERRFQWHGHPFTPREIGYLFAYVGLLGIVLQGGLIGRLVKRFGESALTLSGFVTMSASFFALAFIHGVGALVAISTLSAYATSVIRPSLTSLVSQRAGAHEQGVVLGLNQSLNSIAQIVAPVIGGVLIDHHSLHAWAFVGGSAALAGLLTARWGTSRASLEPQHG